MSKEKFYKSMERFDSFKEELGIYGWLNWEMMDEIGDKLIQCWNKENGEVCIIQLFPNGNGFQDYQMLSKEQELASELMESIKEAKTHLDRYAELIPSSKEWDGKAQALDNTLTKINDLITKAGGQE